MVLPPVDQVIVKGVYRPEIRQEYLLASLLDFYQSLVDIIRLPQMRAGIYREGHSVAIEDKFGMSGVAFVKGRLKVVHWQFDELRRFFELGCWENCPVRDPTTREKEAKSD